MRIKISALGPIHDEAQFDLKPLTIFIGPNNSGKTWLAYTLAGIFSPYGYKFYTDNEHIEDVPQDYPPLIQAIDKILQEGTAKLNLLQFADEYGEYYFNNIAQQAPNWLPDFMSTNNVSFGNMKCLISLTEEKQQFLKHVEDSHIHVGVGVSQKNRISVNIRKNKGEKNLYLYTVSKDLVEEEIPREILAKILAEILAKEVLQKLHYALYPRVTYFPTERTTFITFPFSAISPLFKKIEALLEKLIPVEKPIPETSNIRPLPIPVREFINFINTASKVDSGTETKREKEALTSPEITEYTKIADILEKTILGGKVDFSVADPVPTREIEFYPADSSQAIEIPITSSMVKELAPLVFYLRYFAQPNELIVIDEPEMNLHPKAQVQVLELLAMLVNAGLKVLITTHSPYIMDHLSNLTQAYQHSDKESIRDEFFLKDCNAFIDENKVSTYLIDKGTVRDALHDEELDWDTFGEISDRLNKIFFSSYQDRSEPSE